jgi:hypothetical protein
VVIVCASAQLRRRGTERSAISLKPESETSRFYGANGLLPTEYGRGPVTEKRGAFVPQKP